MAQRYYKVFPFFGAMMTFLRNYRVALTLLGVVMLGAATIPLGGCSKPHDPWPGVQGEGPKVAASFPPLYCFTRAVTGDNDAKVLCLLTKVGPHDYKFDATDALKVQKADVLFVNGLQLDDAVTGMRNTAGNQKVRLVDLGALLEKDHHDLLIHVKHDHHDHGGPGHHHHGEHDPHVWLGMAQAKVLVELIRDQLSELAPDKKDAYHKNAAAYLKKLDELHAYGKQQLSGKKGRVIATHDSLSYFAESFGVKVVANIMPQPGIPPDGKKKAELIKLCTDADNPVRAITVEPQYAAKAAKALIGEIKGAVKDAKQVPALVSFDTLETAEGELGPQYYLDKMRTNIDNLAKALQ